MASFLRLVLADLARPDAQRGAAADERVLLLPARLLVIHELEEDVEASHPEAGEAGVVDDVEHGDQQPRHRGAAHDRARVLHAVVTSAACGYLKVIMPLPRIATIVLLSPNNVKNIYSVRL